MPRTHRQPGEDGALDADRVHHGDRVLDVLAVGIGVLVLRPVRATVAPALDGDHPEVPRQERDLELPLARVHDRPGREQHEARAVGVSEDVVPDADAVPLDLTNEIWFPCAHRPSPRRRHGARRGPCREPL